MAFEWLAPILTPTALRSVQADGRPVITLFLVIFGLSLFGVLCWYIHFGKVAIVTGASRGIGAGLALELARRGAKVTLVYTSLKSGALAEEPDLKQIDASERIVAATREAFGDKIDILVNNAGVLLGKTITETTAEDYAAIFDVNVRAPLLLIKAVVPHLRAPGRIINKSSVGARNCYPKMALYAASKAAVEGMTQSSAQELGDADTLSMQLPRDIVESHLKTTAVQHRVGSVDDIARIVAWLCSEDSKWVSEQTISASGGFLML
ncbi:hypothetical protein BKA66DRAFT_513231 [Pyrenochaeta sp. MPI-SDFR-AT-0127]|nr:hypothetical protein BKA66DRAFT_513231 [Pyrenochaeta sp. MPI-SDFR-AT-0127]